MSELLAEQLKADVSGFESKVADLRGRRTNLLQEIDEVDNNIRSIEPLYTYAKSLLEKHSNHSRTAAATAASAAARRARKEAGTSNPN